MLETLINTAFRRFFIFLFGIILIHRWMIVGMRYIISSYSIEYMFDTISGISYITDISCFDKFLESEDIEWKMTLQ